MPNHATNESTVWKNYTPRHSTATLDRPIPYYGEALRRVEGDLYALFQELDVTEERLGHVEAEALLVRWGLA